MKASIKDMGKVTIIYLDGRLTLGDGDLVLREHVNNCLSGGKTKILINLGKVPYMDSAGIGELVACYKRAVEHKGVIKLVNPASKVQDLLALTKLDQYFETYPNESEALASFAA